MGILLTIMLAPLALVLGVLLVRFVFSPIGIICVFGLVLFVIIAMKTGPTLPDRASRRGNVPRGGNHASVKSRVAPKHNRAPDT